MMQSVNGSPIGRPDPFTGIAAATRRTLRAIQKGGFLSWPTYGGSADDRRPYTDGLYRNRFAFVFIPGPATLLTVARATSSGTKVGLATATGIAAGDVIHTFTAIIGISAVIAASATLFSIMKYLGAAYLVYLGIQAILTKTPSDTMIAKARPITAPKAFKQAILAEVLNPKTALFFLAFLPQFVRSENGSAALQLAALGIVFVLLGLLSCMIFAVSAGSLGNFLRRNPTVLKWQGKIVGGIYCGLGIRLALEEH